MDFFSYLKNSGTDNSKEISQKKESKKLKNITNDISKEKIEENNKKHILNHNFKRGETVLITKYENSIFNVYKGYYAEIKEYRENSDYAFVILPALNYPILMKIHIGHFTKVNNNYITHNL